MAWEAAAHALGSRRRRIPQPPPSHFRRRLKTGANALVGCCKPDRANRSFERTSHGERLGAEAQPSRRLVPALWYARHPGNRLHVHHLVPRERRRNGRAEQSGDVLRLVPSAGGAFFGARVSAGLRKGGGGREDSGAMDDAKGVMRKMVEMFATGDLATLNSVVSTDYIDHQGIDGVEIEGREGFADLVRAVHAPYGTALRVTIEELIGEEDRAAARLRWHHTGADGRVVERETIDIIRSSKGLALEHWGAEVTRPDAG